MDEDQINDLKEAINAIKTTYVGPRGPIADGLLILMESVVKKHEERKAEKKKNENNR